MVDLYWKCYAYGDELKPHIEFLDGIMLSSTRDIAPSCVENVDELIERQEKSLTQLETKRGVVKDLIEKGKKILENPDKPKFLEGNVKKIQEGWEETKEVKKKYNLQAAQDDLKKRQDLYNAAQKKIDNLFKSINDNFTCMSITLPEDKKKTVDKEIKAVQEKLEVAGRFGSAVKQIEDFVNNLNAFDVAL